MLQISPQVGGPSQRPARLTEQTEQVLPCLEAKCRLAWQAPSGLLPFTTSPALPTGVNEEHLYKLAPPNGLFDGFGVRTSFFGWGADRVKHVSRESTSPAGCVATFKKRQESDGSGFEQAPSHATTPNSLLMN